MSHKMTRDEALAALREIAARQKEPGYCTMEEDHGSADSVLLQVIDDDEITAAYDAIDKWYA